jgi:hypothetical protein
MKKDSETTFDDLKYLEKSTYHHIEKIEFFMSDGLLSGIGVTLNLDGIIITKFHRGSRKPKTSYELEIHQDEHIEFMQIHYDVEGVREVLVKTNLGHMLVMDENHGNERFLTREINLADSHEGLVGFKT